MSVGLGGPRLAGMPADGAWHAELHLRSAGDRVRQLPPGRERSERDWCTSAGTPRRPSVLLGFASAIGKPMDSTAERVHEGVPADIGTGLESISESALASILWHNGAVRSNSHLKPGTSSEPTIGARRDPHGRPVHCIGVRHSAGSVKCRSPSKGCTRRPSSKWN